MSDELFEKDELEDEDVEGHRTRARVRSGSEELEGDDDVEGHRTRARVRSGSEEPEGDEDVEAHLKVRAASDDDSDDVEAHLKQA